MNETILLVGHGSREAEGNDAVREFVRRWRAMHPGWRIELGFIELAEPAMADALRRAAQGSDEVLVLPLILNAAGHVKAEIPEAIDAARAACPGTRFRVAPHLQADAAIVGVLRRRLAAAMRELDVPDPATTGVVLLGRGSSDAQANAGMAQLARRLYECGEHELVDLAFTGVTSPRLERVVQRQALVGMRQVVVLPYYLFTGTLMQRIERQVGHLRAQYPTLRFALGDCLGFEPEIFAALDDRVARLLAGAADADSACDGCHWRETAQAAGVVPAHGHGHGHGHHDRAPAGCGSGCVGHCAGGAPA